MDRTTGVSVCLLGAAALALVLGVGALPGGAGVASGDDVGNEEETPIDIDTDRVSIDLQAEQINVGHDETVVFLYAVTNYVTNDEPVTVQLILEAPLGSQVSASQGQEAGSGSQFTTTTTLEPGGQDTLRIEVDLSEPGTREILGEAVYFFGDNRSTGAGRETTITVTQASPTPLSKRVIGAPATVYGAIADTTPDGTVPPGVTRASIFASVLLFVNISFFSWRYLKRRYAGFDYELFLGYLFAVGTLMFLAPPLLDWLRVSELAYTVLAITFLSRFAIFLLFYFYKLLSGLIKKDEPDHPA